MKTHPPSYISITGNTITVTETYCLSCGMTVESFTREAESLGMRVILTD